MKNHLAIAFALILCFASMSFAQTPSRFGAQGASNTVSSLRVSPQPKSEALKPTQGDTSFHVDIIIDTLDLVISFLA
jgi:hypothetical protein